MVTFKRGMCSTPGIMLLVCLCASFWGAGIGKSEGASEAACAVSKGEPPLAKEMPRLPSMRAAEATFENGFHLVVMEDRRFPIVQFRLRLTDDGACQADDFRDVARQTAAMLYEGTRVRSAQEIQDAIGSAGARTAIEGGSCPSVAVITGQSLVERFANVFAAVGDAVANSEFPQGAVDQYAKRNPNGARPVLAPWDVAVRYFERALDGRAEPLPGATRVRSREELVAFYREHYAPEKAVLFVWGDMSLAEARRIVEPAVSTWKSRAREQRVGGLLPNAAESALVPPLLTLVDYPGANVVGMTLGVRAPERTSADYEAMLVLQYALSFIHGSRLKLKVVIPRGIYVFNGLFDATNGDGDPGVWRAEARVSDQQAAVVLKEIVREIEKMRTEPLAECEFERAKRKVLGSIGFTLSHPGLALYAYPQLWANGLPADYWQGLPARLAAVTPQRVQEAAKRYLSRDRLQIVLVGNNVSALKEELAAYGTAKTYTYDRAPVPPPVPTSEPR